MGLFLPSTVPRDGGSNDGMFAFTNFLISVRVSFSLSLSLISLSTTFFLQLLSKLGR